MKWRYVGTEILVLLMRDAKTEHYYVSVDGLSGDMVT